MIFDYKKPKKWDSVISKVLINILGKSYVNKIKKNAEIFKYADRIDYGCELFSSKIDREDLIMKVSQIISNRFNEVIAYHACRPVNIDDYYIKGIEPLSPKLIQKQFRKYFNPYLSRENIDSVINNESLKTREGFVYVKLDDRELLKSNGHYLIYGSEYLNCLAYNSKGSEYYRDILKNFGNATIFVCRLPFSEINELELLVRNLIADHFYRIAHPERYVHLFNYSITRNFTIPPEAIVRHYHPIRIVDYFKSGLVWNDKKMKYE